MTKRTRSPASIYRNWASASIRDAMAKRLKEAAAKAWQLHRSQWAGDTELLEMFDTDYAQHLLVAKYIEENKLSWARRTVTMMDTAASDDIPVAVIAWLYDQE